MGLSINQYNSAFAKFAKNALPHFFRFEWLKDFIYSLIKPLQDVSDDFYSTISTVDLYLKYTSQHLSMEEMLNDKYDSTLRRIYITENNVIGQDMDIYKESETNPNPRAIYKQGEDNPVPILIYKQSEYPISVYNFTINMPVTITYDSDEFEYLINSYTEPRTFNVVTF